MKQETKADKSRVVLYIDKDVEESKSREISQRLSLDSMEDLKALEKTDLMLHLTVDGVTLEQEQMVLRGDFEKMIPRLKASKLKYEKLVQAAKLIGKTESPLAIDATAGLGEDAILLAAAGFRVHLYEYNKIVAILLEDALRKGAENPALKDIIGRMKLIQEDSIVGLKHLEEKPDLILIDPMFPERQKSALIKKKFQLIQQLEQPCMEEEALLQAAIAAEPRKIIIKRPLKGPELGGVKPDYAIKSKVIRYDCLLQPRYHQE